MNEPETEDMPSAPRRRRRRFAPAVLGIGGVCILVELVLQLADLHLVGSPLWRSLAYQNGAFWPGLLHGWQPNYRLQPAAMFFTYALLHGGLGHLTGNMLTLMALGEIVVERAGSKGFLLVYAASALGGAALFGLLAASPQPMVGASGALFGLAGAWQYWDYAGRPPGRGRFWRLLQVVVLLVLLNVVLWSLLGGVLAWQTHLGGFLAGWIAAAALARGRRGKRMS